MKAKAEPATEPMIIGKFCDDVSSSLAVVIKEIQIMNRYLKYRTNNKEYQNTS